MSRRVIALAVLVAAVAGWLFLRELPELRNAEEQAAQERLIFQEFPDVVDTLRLRRGDREILIARATGEESGWWLRSPIVEKIPDFTAQDIIQRLAATERWRRVARAVEGADWGLYGLAEESPGRVRIEIIGPGRRVAIDVGLLTPSATTVWVRRPGSDELELCLEDLYDLANATHQGFRDPRLFSVAREDLASLSFESDQGTWSAYRDETGLWYLGSATGPRLRRWILEDFAFAVVGLRVDGYLRDGLAESDWAAYGLDAPWGTVRWTATDGRAGTLWLGNEVSRGLSFGRRSGLDTVFQIASGLDALFAVDPQTLLDRNPVVGNFLLSPRMRVSGGEGFVEIVRETPGVRLATEAGPLPPAEYGQVAGRNLQLGIEEFQPLSEMIVPSGKDAGGLLESAEARLTVYWPEREVQLTIGRMAGRVWVAIEGEQTLYEAPVDLLLRVREVLSLRVPD